MLDNKKNGFTIIELIATITLLAVFSVVVLLNMTGLKTAEDNKNIERFNNHIEEAACSYIDMIENTSLRSSCKSSGCNIYLSQLIASDIALVDSDAIDPYTNMKVESEKDCVYVQISWEQKDNYKEKKCEMKRGASCQ